MGFSALNRNRAQSKTLPRKNGGSRSNNGSLILPPPPQYKGVHFAPGVSEDDFSGVPLPPIPSGDPMMIPTEGLPTRPAPKKGTTVATAATAATATAASKADHIIVADSVTIRLNNRRAKEEVAMKPKPPPPKRIRCCFCA